MPWTKELRIKPLYAEYYIRRRGPNWFEVTKFLNGGDQPTSYYTLRRNQYGILCDCLGPKYRCKHGWLVPELERFEQQFGLEAYPCCYTEQLLG